MGLAIGIDIGASFIRVGVIDDAGRVIVKEKAPVPSEGGENTMAELIISMINEKIPRKYVDEASAIGVGSIGPLDLRSGNVLIAPNLKWSTKRFRVVDPIARAINKKVILCNDAAAAAWGEHVFGDGKGIDNLVYITLSTGIGAGVIVDGNLLIGKDGNAHEVGHLVVDADLGVRCGCGGIGHWEAIASGGNMPRSIALFMEKRYNGPRTRLYEAVNRGGIASQDIFRYAQEGDALAVEFIDYIADIHARGIAGVINAYDPELIVLGGSVIINNSDVLLPKIIDKISKYTANRIPEIKLTRFGDDIGIIGAAALVHNVPATLRRFL